MRKKSWKGGCWEVGRLLADDDVKQTYICFFLGFFGPCSLTHLLPCNCLLPFLPSSLGSPPLHLYVLFYPNHALPSQAFLDQQLRKHRSACSTPFPPSESHVFYCKFSVAVSLYFFYSMKTIDLLHLCTNLDKFTEN